MGAQNGEPYAEILNDPEEYCEPSGSISYELEIKFYGAPPFGLRYRTPKGTNFENDPIQTQDLTEVADNEYLWTTTVPLTLDPENDSRITAEIELLEVFDNNYGTLNSDGDWEKDSGVDINDQNTTVTNWAMPSPEAGSPIDSCGLTAVMDATPDDLSDQYYWETVNDGTFSDEQNINAIFEGDVKGEYTLTFTQENGACIASDDVNVNLIGAPAGSISTSSEVCGTSPQEVSIDLSFTGDGPWEYAISDGTETVIQNTTSQATTTETLTVNGETTFSFQWIQDANGCYARDADIEETATVIDNKPDTYAGEDNTICGLEYTLEAIPDKGTGEWTTSDENLSISSPGDPHSAITANEPGTYTLTWTEDNNGCENTDQVEIKFVRHPDIEFGETETTICIGDEAALDIDISDNNGPWTLHYERNGNPTSTEIASDATSLALSPDETSQYSNISITDQFGCTTESEEELSINVYMMPSPDAGRDTAVCNHEIELEANMSDVAQAGEWTSQSGVFANPTDPESRFEATDHSEPVYGEYTLTWTETNGLCTASDQVSVRFDRFPTPDAGKDLTLYHQYETTLNGVEPVAGNGEWQVRSGPGNIADKNNHQARISGLQHGQTILEWRVSNGVCPTVSDTMTITVKDLTYYTGISPNGDGINDHFKIKGAHTIPGNELIVFDQNGQVVYREKDLGEENAWDGRERDGSKLKEGIYYFIFRGEGIETIRDYIVIKRN
ncbi:MAG: gliding motility-associated C-terminal domain-containing protein [Bacteroidota bacterium]